MHHFKMTTLIRLSSILTFIMLTVLTACGQTKGTNHKKNDNNKADIIPKRISNIPIDAFWVGGVDGGQWYRIDSINTTEKSIHFKIYNDFNGNLVIDKKFKLHCDNDPEIKWDYIRGQINAFDGQRILLTIINKDHKYCYFE
jgi:hypothetical protein